MSRTHYVHILLFPCLECQLPASITLLSDKRDREQIDRQIVCVECRFCGCSSDAMGVTAVKHLVEVWDEADLPHSYSDTSRTGS
jgi:hypothetical protein